MMFIHKNEDTICFIDNERLFENYYFSTNSNDIREPYQIKNTSKIKNVSPMLTVSEILKD